MNLRNILFPLALTATLTTGCGEKTDRGPYSHFSGTIIEESSSDSLYQARIETTNGMKVIEVSQTTGGYYPSVRSVDLLWNVGDTIDFMNLNPEFQIYQLTTDDVANQRGIRRSHNQPEQNNQYDLAK